MTDSDPSPDSNEMTDGHAYWNGEGGDIWVRNMERTEANFVSMTAELLAAAAPQPGEKVLDVGCGGGTTSAEIARRVAPAGHVLGVDISATILAVAQQRHGQTPGLRFEQADAGRAEVPAEAFDLLFSRFGVMFFDQPVAAFLNLRNALKQRGRVAFMCWRSLPENPWIAEPTQAAVAVLGEEHRPTPPADPRAPGPFALAEADYIDQLLRAAGFGGIQIDPHDGVMHLDDVETALNYLKNMGPIAQALPQVSPEEALRVDDAMREALRRYEKPGSLDLPSATWIVTARR